MLSRTLGITIAGTVAISLAGVWAVRFMLRRWRKSPEEIERLRRLSVNACGRIISGSILGLAELARKCSPRQSFFMRTRLLELPMRRRRT